MVPNRSVLKATQLLEAIARAGGPVGLSDLSRVTGIPKATALRLLAALERAGLIARETGAWGGRYSLGGRLLYLASRVRGDSDLVARARPFLERLHAATGETTGLYQRYGDQVVCVECLVSQHPVRLHMCPGAVGPLYVGASARVLLAHAAPEEIDAVLAGPLERRTERTLVDPEALRRELEQIRRQGYSVSVGEMVPYTAAVSVPIRDHSGRVVAAMSVAGPEARLAEKLEMIRDLLIQAGHELSQQLGYAAEG